MASLAHQDWHTVKIWAKKPKPDPKARPSTPSHRQRQLEDHHLVGQTRPIKKTSLTAPQIVSARSAQGMTQAQLATKLNVKPAVVRAWEQRQAFPEGRELAVMRRVLKI